VHAPTTLHTVWDVVGEWRMRGRVSDRALSRARRDSSVGLHDRDIVFVHGLGMATDYLEPTMSLLAGDFSVSGLDLPGFGGSRIARNRVLSLRELADALDGWMRVRGIESPIVVGQSHGCQVVVEWAVRSQLPGAIVLNAPTMLDGHRSVLAQIARVAMDTPREPLALIPHVVRDYLRAGPRRILATLADALRDRIEDKLPLVDRPTTIVCGARDPVVPPAWGERLARLVGSQVGGSGAQFRIVEGAAHAVPFSHPEALASEIEAMAARLDQPASAP
jgi:2-hydroxy-6-oxonona-2,4-dienedioate hydrolase